MKRTARMEKIANINKNFEQMAGLTFSAAQMEYQRQLDQLNQLKIYRNEYKDRYRDRLNTPIRKSEIHDFKFFFNSLEDAIVLQEKKVDEALEQMDNFQMVWMDKKNEVTKISKLAQHARDDELVDDLRQESKELDEMNQTFFNHHRGNNHH